MSLRSEGAPGLLAGMRLPNRRPEKVVCFAEGPLRPRRRVKTDLLLRQRQPIDFFFRSRAQDLRERATGIVLSGTGSDGTPGVRAIKGEGGMVMALDTLIPKDVEVQSRAGSWYSMRILPYRTLENVFEGPVITFVDIADMKQARDEARKSVGLHAYKALVAACSDVAYRMSPDWSRMLQLHGGDFIPDTEEPQRCLALEIHSSRRSRAGDERRLSGRHRQSRLRV